MKSVADKPAIPAYNSAGDQIGIVPHIQNGFNGSSIDMWERRHFIERYAKNGCEYVRCVNLDALTAMVDEEEGRRRRDRLNTRIAEQQAQAYGIS